MEDSTVLRPFGLPRSRGMIFPPLADPELSHRSTTSDLHSRRRSDSRWSRYHSAGSSSQSLPQRSSSQVLSRETTWQTFSGSDPSVRYLSLDPELQEWWRRILEFAEREDLAIARYSDSSEPSSTPFLRRSEIRQRRREGTVFALPEDVLVRLRAPTTEYGNDTTTLPRSPATVAFQTQPSDALDAEISGGYRADSRAGIQWRSPPQADPHTLRALEGRRTGNGNESEDPNRPWTSGTIAQLENDILSYLGNPESASVGRDENVPDSSDIIERQIMSQLDDMQRASGVHTGGDSRPPPDAETRSVGENDEMVEDSEDHSSILTGPIPSYPIPVRTRSKQGRMGRLRRWCKRIVMR